MQGLMPVCLLALIGAMKLALKAAHCRFGSVRLANLYVLVFSTRGIQIGNDGREENLDAPKRGHRANEGRVFPSAP